MVLIVEPGSTAARGFVVSNRGGAPTTALDVGTALAAPFQWGPAGTAGTFPGGSGTGTVNGLEYPYCTTPTLGVGEQCMVTVSLSPTGPYATVDTAVNLAYSDASGPVSPNANRGLRGSPTGGGL